MEPAGESLGDQVAGNPKEYRADSNRLASDVSWKDLGQNQKINRPRTKCIKETVGHDREKHEDRR